MDPTNNMIKVGEINGSAVWASVAQTPSGPKVVYHRMMEFCFSSIRDACMFVSPFAHEGRETVEQAKERVDQTVKQVLECKPNGEKMEEVSDALGEEDVKDHDSKGSKNGDEDATENDSEGSIDEDEDAGENDSQGSYEGDDFC